MTTRLLDSKEYVETSEAVKIAGRSESHLRLLARKSKDPNDKYYGKLPCKKIFGRWAYDKAALEELVGIVDSECEQREVVKNGSEEINGGIELDL